MQTASGAEIGIVMLDNDLPRPVGDVGNPSSYPFPVELRVSSGARTEQVIAHGADGLAASLTDTARGLAADGARAVSTCCGFLAIHQREIAGALDVPVATSSLLQIPLVLQLLRPDQVVLVLTADSRTLTEGHFDAVGVGPTVRERMIVRGIESTAHLHPVLMGSAASLDVDRASAEVVALAVAAMRQQPRIGAVVLECTNLSVYSTAIAGATGLPVWDAVTLIRWLQSGVAAVRHAEPQPQPQP